jgi:hypothetical protein
MGGNPAKMLMPVGCGIGIAAVPQLPKLVTGVQLPYPALDPITPPPNRCDVSHTPPSVETGRSPIPGRTPRRSHRCLPTLPCGHTHPHPTPINMGHSTNGSCPAVAVALRFVSVMGRLGHFPRQWQWGLGTKNCGGSTEASGSPTDRRGSACYVCGEARCMTQPTAAMGRSVTFALTTMGGLFLNYRPMPRCSICPVALFSPAEWMCTLTLVGLPSTLPVG